MKEYKVFVLIEDTQNNESFQEQFIVKANNQAEAEEKAEEKASMKYQDYDQFSAC